MKKIFQNWGPVLVYFILIFIGSSIPVQVKPGVDKVLHILEYGLMGFFTARGVLLTWDLPKVWGCLLGTLMAGSLGVLDEIHQYFVPGRSSSVYDAMADFTGALLGALCFVMLGSLLYRSDKLYSRPHDSCC
ncbi:MAG: VanZ family protein [Deltaproteobacteria bacterium]|nr:VanZ family protein [Deltaproteobacteria bacterium]